MSAASLDTATPPVRELVDRVFDTATRTSRRGQRFLYRHALRFGHRVECPICGWTGQRFVPSFKPTVPDRICPNCKSAERYRALELWLRRTGPTAGARLLEIAPIHLVKSTALDLGYSYASLDLSSTRTLVLGDLCRAPFRDDAFDLIVCFHVLEHIPDDDAAASEIRRLLSPGGTAIIVVPWEATRTETFEHASDDPADNERLYGQSDHVRIYGADVTDRLRAAGLEVDEVTWNSLFSADELRKYRLPGDDDRFWICRVSA